MHGSALNSAFDDQIQRLTTAMPGQAVGLSTSDTREMKSGKLKRSGCETCLKNTIVVYPIKKIMCTVVIQK